MTDNEFEKIVRETLDELPVEFKRQLDNVEVVIEDFFTDTNGNRDLHLLGLYHGVPKTERNSYLQLPDKISIYKFPILMVSKDTHDAKKRIKATVLHELGHHFGLSDEDLEKTDL